jgi:hypothetical protein
MASGGSSNSAYRIQTDIFQGGGRGSTVGKILDAEI